MKTLRILLLLFSVFSPFLAFSQEEQQPAVSPALAEDYIATQLSVYPQEKIHLHTDKEHYMAGEKLWFRAYLVDYASHLPDSASRYVYVELVNPADSIAHRVRVRQQDGVYAGYLPIPEELPEGSYTLRAYTRYMAADSTGFFRKSVYVANLLASRVEPRASFTYGDGKLLLDLSYAEGGGEAKVMPDSLFIKDEKGNMKFIRMDRDSVAHISWDLPLAEGWKGAYVEMDNYHHFIPFRSPEADYDVSFYPEGGYLLEEVPCRIAFKALKPDGLSEEVTGMIRDDSGEEVVEIKTVYAGMGVATFIPRKGKRYHAECENRGLVKRRFELPEAVSDAYALKTNVQGGNLYLAVNRSPDMAPADSLYILLHARGSVNYFGLWDNRKEYIYFPTDDLSPGLLQAILFDRELNPLSERLVFNNKPAASLLTIETDKNHYKDREKVSARIRLTDTEGIPLEGTFSVAVTDDSDMAADSSLTILSTLLLTSEIRGHIENPAYYLRPGRGNAFALDMLLMTQGWRLYDIPRAVKGDIALPSAEREQAMRLTGHTERLFTSRAQEGSTVTLLARTAAGEWYKDETVGDEEGKFDFGPIEFPDSSTLFIEAYTSKNRKALNLFVDKEEFPPVSPSDRLPVAGKRETGEEGDDAWYEKMLTRAKYDGDMRVIHLKSVEVTARRIERDKPYSIYSSMAASRLDSEQIERINTSDIYMLMLRVPGLTVVSNGYKEQVVVFARNPGTPATIYIDDVPFSDQAQALGSVNPSEIDRIETIRNTLMYGVNIITKQGHLKPKYYEKTNIAQLFPVGFQRPSEFYAPKYETPEEKTNPTPDLRTTICWKPDITIREDGEASVRFYTSDTRNTAYTVVIEGITQDGEPMRKTEKIRIE